MAKLRVKDKVGLGKYIVEAAQDSKIGDDLVNNSVERLDKYVDIPKVDKEGKPVTHTIEIHRDTEHITHMVLPWKDDVDNAFDKIDQQDSIYPNEYRVGAPEYIDDKKFPRRALWFRFGEYMFGRCKT